MEMSSKIFILTITLVGVAGCYQKPQPSEGLSPKAQELYDEKIAARKADLERECINRVVEAAQVKVDSILWLRTYQEKLDFFHVPERPEKPGMPVIPKIEDSTPVKPLWQDSVALPQDTLRRPKKQ